VEGGVMMGKEGGCGGGRGVSMLTVMCNYYVKYRILPIHTTENRTPGRKVLLYYITFLYILAKFPLDSEKIYGAITL
jgi:hypothetical protein